MIHHPYRRMNRKKATAVVEMAVVLPLLITLLFGIIEFGWTFMAYQTIVNAAREGCRVAVLQGATDTEIYDRMSFYMDKAGLGNTGWSWNSGDHTSEDGKTETITLSVPYSKISLLGGYFGSTNFNIAGRASMRKEGVE